MARKKGQKEIEKKNQALATLDIQYIPVDQIVPNDYNPNRQGEHDFNLLEKSMREDGFTQPIVLTQPNEDGKYVIVDGEHRWRCAAQRLGMTEIPCAVTHFSPEQAKIATLRHNRARGSEDFELSAELLRDLEQLGAREWAMDSLVMDSDEWDNLVADMEVPEALAQEDYDEAWEVREESEDSPDDDGRPKETMTNGRRTIAHSSPEAIEAIRKREQAMREAQTEEDRETARKENAVYRVSLTFTGEQGDIVRAVIGDAPAKKILEMCEAELDKAETT